MQKENIAILIQLNPLQQVFWPHLFSKKVGKKVGKRWEKRWRKEKK
jgi:hypothetical protein